MLRSLLTFSLPALKLVFALCLCISPALEAQATSHLGADGKSKSAVRIKSTRSPEADALFNQLKSQMGKGILFGHQNATLYGRGWHSAKGAPPDSCDIKESTGCYPAVYGWDFNTIWNPMVPESKIPQKLAHLRSLIKKASKRGGIHAFSWHMWNPVTKQNFYDTTPAVKHILPGGNKHEWFKKELRRIADFFRSLKDDRGNPIPVIFRPFHEHNLKCFWWSLAHCSKKQHSQLFEFTVRHLRDHLGVRNALYAISPSGKSIHSQEDYLSIAPDLDLVDVLGIDYYDISNKQPVKVLEHVVRLSKKYNKIAALTECGYKKGLGEAPHDYYTQNFLKPFKNSSLAKEIAFCMVWQNASAESYWIPVKGDPHLKDFLNFCRDPFIILRKD
ncbi:MAG: hypothetical protein HQL32_03360 [Planctomycetes bacterium]|nr:hypothetical protein [Planctomycetota bacterium]